jgi:pimeloyl-ACP methyl ester carboxylesterase
VTAASVVLVHGAWHGAWCWEKVVTLLDGAGVPSVAVELPLTSLADDVAATRQAVDAIGGPVVLCGHSYGGVVISEAGDHPDVRHLVYLCAFVVEEGHSGMNAVDEPTPSGDLEHAVRLGEDGSVTLDRQSARTCFYLDCSPADADAALDRLRPTAMACLIGTTTTAAWRHRPSTYVVCTEDKAGHPDLQRTMARRCTDVVEWPTSHSPFLSRPDLVAELLVEISGTASAPADA